MRRGPGILPFTASYYPRLLLANAAAISAGAQSIETTVDGKDWGQQAFPYQAKCLKWLRDEHAALGNAHRALADRVLSGTRWTALFA